MAELRENKMFSSKKIVSVGASLLSIVGVVAMSSIPVAAAEGTIEVV